MRRYNIGKKLFAYGMISVMLMGMMTGCGKKDDNVDVVYTQDEASATEALVIGDYSINMDELMVYSIQEIVTYGVKPEKIDADEAGYKEQTLALLRETKILYDVALHNGVELNDSDIQAKDELVNNFKSIVPNELFEKYGISDEIIDKVFTERTYVEKFENDIRNQMGQDISDDLTESYADKNFQTMYHMVFPIIEVDENDEPKKDDDGNYIELSDDEKKAVKERAEAALKDIEDGKEPEVVAEEYGISPYCSDTSGYVGAYSEEMNEILADIKAGECTDVLEGDTGYTIIYMKTVNDEALRDSYVYAVANDYLDSQYEALRNQWLATIPVDVEGDIRGTTWADFNMREMAVILDEAGLVTEK